MGGLASTAWTTTWVQFFLAPLGVLVIVGIVRAMTTTVDRWRSARRAAERDEISVSEFLFGREGNPRTRTPAVEGWTTVMERKLDKVVKDTAATADLVKEVLENQRNGHG